MSYRKITVNEQEYQYSIGKSHTKVKGFKVFENRMIGDPISGTSDYVVTPYNVANAIKGIYQPRVVDKCSHGTVTHETTIDPFDAEIYGEQREMINCPKCVHERAMDI